MSEGVQCGGRAAKFLATSRAWRRPRTVSGRSLSAGPALVSSRGTLSAWRSSTRRRCVSEASSERHRACKSSAAGLRGSQVPSARPQLGEARQHAHGAHTLRGRGTTSGSLAATPHAGRAHDASRRCRSLGGGLMRCTRSCCIKASVGGALCVRHWVARLSVVLSWQHLAGASVVDVAPPPLPRPLRYDSPDDHHRRAGGYRSSSPRAVRKRGVRCRADTQTRLASRAPRADA